MTDLAREIYEGMKQEQQLPEGYWPLWDFLEADRRSPFQRIAASCRPPQPEFQAWHSYGSKVSRMRVATGWLYKFDDTPHMMFVPGV